MKIELWKGEEYASLSRCSSRRRFVGFFGFLSSVLPIGVEVRAAVGIVIVGIVSVVLAHRVNRAGWLAPPTAPAPTAGRQ